MSEQADLARSVVRQNFRALMELLQRHSPFDQMEVAHLAFLLERSRLTFHPKGSVVFSPEHGKADRLFIVKQGVIQGERDAGPGKDPEIAFELLTGNIFPLAALLGERPTRTAHRAVEDSFCFELARDDFEELFAISEEFRDFCLRGVSSLLDRLNQHIQAQAASNLKSGANLHIALADLTKREPVTCPPDTRIQDAVAIMHRGNISSLIITDEARHPTGIFTLRDLRRIVAEGNTDLDSPISQVMTPDPMALRPSDRAIDAALIMAGHHFGHICVTDDNGKLVGVLSERDLFSLQRVDLVHLARTIASAPSIDALAASRREIHLLIDNMLAHGAHAPELCRIITLLNDYTVDRCIELVKKQHNEHVSQFCWLAFGSEGRREQTLSTDQDNGILFNPAYGAETEEERKKLLRLAEKINHALAKIGFPLCKGNVMASNPALCLSEQEWEDKFSDIIASNTPENLLKSSIYFDFRPLWGDTDTAERMFQRIVRRVGKQTLFQRMMAGNAMENRPPLGIVRDFVYSGAGEEKHTVDLKTQGLSPFVDAGRVLALAHGITDSNTIDRLEALGEQGELDARDVKTWVEAYSFIQLLRMRQHQNQLREGKPLSNRIDPDRLNELDRSILKESFRQARRIQKRLALKYQL